MTSGHMMSRWPITWKQGVCPGKEEENLFLKWMYYMNWILHSQYGGAQNFLEWSLEVLQQKQSHGPKMQFFPVDCNTKKFCTFKMNVCRTLQADKRFKLLMLV